MARPMTAVGNSEIANSPDFSSRPSGGDSGIPPSANELQDLDKAMDEAAVVDKPVEEVDREIQRKAANKAPEKKAEAPANEPEKKSDTGLEKSVKEEEGRKIEVPKLPKLDVKAPEIKAPEVKKEEPKDEEIDSIQEPKGLNPSNRENWKKLQDAAKNYKREAVENKKKYAETLEAVNKAIAERNKLPEPVEKELNELRSFRRTFDYERDPEFMDKFHKPIEQQEEAIFKILGENGISKEDIDAIKKAGLNTVTQDAWDETINKLTDTEDQKKRGLNQVQIQRERESAFLLRKHLNTREEKLIEKKQEIEKITAGQSEWVKNKEQMTKADVDQEIAFVKENLEKLEKDYDILRPLQAPADATPEQKKAVDEHNGFLETVKKQFVVSYRPANKDQRFDAAMKSAYALIVDRELQKETGLRQQAEEQLKLANEELDKIKNATRMNTDTIKTEEGTKAKSGDAATKYIGIKSDVAIDEEMAKFGL